MSMLISHCLNVISEVPSLTHRKKIVRAEVPDRVAKQMGNKAGGISARLFEVLPRYLGCPDRCRGNCSRKSVV